MRYLYTILFYLALPWIFLRLLWRSRKSADYRKRWSERLGFTPCQFQKCIWVHAVSLGETIAAVPLIKALKAQFPELPLVVTNMTLTGAARVKAVFGESVTQLFVPYDTPSAVERFLNRIHPVALIVMETELWPNLFAKCREKNVPIVLANARLSEKSAAGYQKVASLTRDMLQTITKLASQGHADAERFIALGIEKEKVTVTGNLKFDLEVPNNLMDKKTQLRAQLGNDRLIWIAASTHPGEEEVILAAHKIIQQKIPHVLLILVPRHPERFDAVTALCEQQGFRTVRRSQQVPCTEQIDIYISDTMGELLLMYAVADIAFIGGSFVPVGGHNMLEPGVLGKPIVTATYLFNFAEISDLFLKNQAMLCVQDAASLSSTVVRLFENSAERQALGDNALRVVNSNRGALAKQVQLITDVIACAP